VRKLIGIACFLALFSLSAMAADYPKAEVFGGYQFTHLEGSGNFNGLNFAVNGNLNEWLGIAVDIGTAYKTYGGVSFSNYTYTFGPVMSLRANKSHTPFVHALIGGDHGAGSAAGISVSGNGFALLAGGGVDWNVAPHLAVRAAQADWMMVHGSGATSSKNFRISTGIVVKF